MQNFRLEKGYGAARAFKDMDLALPDFKSLAHFEINFSQRSFSS